jgi:hypothetical protein
LAARLQAAASDGRRFFLASAQHGPAEGAYINELAVKLSDFFTVWKGANLEYLEIAVLIHLA